MSFLPTICEDKRLRGLKEIEAAKWEKNEELNYWEIKVKDALDRDCRVSIEPRPRYCDRGHYMLKVDGFLDIDYADLFPRYFFSFVEASRHAKAFLKWRIWKVRGDSC